MDGSRDPWGRDASQPDVAARTPGDRPAWVTDDVGVVRASLVIETPATALGIRGVRREFASWLEMDVLPGELSDDLVLAVYEALANVVDHAYGDLDGDVRLAAHRTHGSLRVTVSDHGRWRPSTSSPFRGRGLGVVRLLVAEVHLATDGAGTDLHLRSALPEPTAPTAPTAPV